MVLNFVGFVGLAVLLLTFARARGVLRVGVDLLLACMSAATLYAWNAMGRANPMGTGTLALVVEAMLIVVVVADAAILTMRSNARSAGTAAAHSNYD